MSKIEISLPDEFPFDLSSVAGLEHIPAEELQRFQDQINAAVGERLAGFGVESAEDVKSLTLQDWSDLRRSLMGVEITMETAGVSA